VAEYVFDALAAEREPPEELGEALRLAFTEIIDASTAADWQRVGDDLVAVARENLGERGSPAAAPTPVANQPRRTRRRYPPNGPHARARRETAGSFIDALEDLREGNPGTRVTLTELARRANAATETLFQQFGRTAGLYWAVDARAATRFPALWAEVGFAEAATPVEQIKATAQEYVRLLLAHPGPMRALLRPEELDELLRPKDPRSYRTLAEFTAALRHRVAEQDYLLTEILAGLLDDRAAASDVINELNGAWLRVAALAWQVVAADPAELSKEIAARTEAILSKLTPTATAAS
jgi:AcrR family transcriptional regulator